MDQHQISMDLRKSPRAQLRMPVRLRWKGSLGMRLQVTETLDVSKDGMLILRRDPHGVGARVWIAFPFEPAAATAAQPETPARVVRVDPEPAGGFRVAVKLELPHRDTPPPAHIERRKAPRVPFALPVFVRPKGTPWPEESMTRDISKYGALMDTSHVYRIGDLVLAKIPWGDWSIIGEIPGRVVRIQRGDLQSAPLEPSSEVAPFNALRSIAVEWNPQVEEESAEKKPPAPERPLGSPIVPRFKLM